MSYTKANVGQGDEKAPGMYFLREALDCENLGFTVIDAEAGWTGMEHDHGDGDHEEVYYLVEGTATIEIEGSEVSMDAGDAVRVAPEASRTLSASESSTFVVVGAP
ncbi:cupin domain-containing protein [Halobellus captivus]|uniref:cupin domain-containing protein n=1 Tax=Halobellus captivus TaxID=2592614 RepID=UPI0011A4AA53|nr:cupin domain-containing protein [Halobellus captivus]